jgi:hypothetical protein
MNIGSECSQLNLRSRVNAQGNVRSAESFGGRLNRDRYQLLIVAATERKGDTDAQSQQTRKLLPHSLLPVNGVFRNA